MAKIWYGHFDSVKNDERLLLAEDWAFFIRSFVTSGIRNGGMNLKVEADTGMQVKLHPGTANLEGYIFDLSKDSNGTTYPIVISTADPVYPRIDRIVLRLDRRVSVRNIMPFVIKGTPQKNPSPPAINRSKELWDLSLCQVYVHPQTTVIIHSHLTDERFQTDLCGLMNSVLGLDPSAWQSVFDQFIKNCKNENKLFFDDKQAAFDKAIADNNKRFNHWLDQTMVDLNKTVQFQFDNLAAFPGNQKTTIFNKDGSITETLKTTNGNILVAQRVTFFEKNGNIACNEKVYEKNGINLIRNTSVTTIFNKDGSIKEVIQ